MIRFQDRAPSCQPNLSGRWSRFVAHAASDSIQRRSTHQETLDWDCYVEQSLVLTAMSPVKSGHSGVDINLRTISLLRCSTIVAKFDLAHVVPMEELIGVCHDTKLVTPIAAR